MGLALEKDAEECYSVDMNDAVRHGMCVSVLASELARELGCDEEFTRLPWRECCTMWASCR